MSFTRRMWLFVLWESLWGPLGRVPSCLPHASAGDPAVPLLALRPVRSPPPCTVEPGRAPFCYSKELYPNEFFLHIHLPKCGGTTLYSLFDKSNCRYATYSFNKTRVAEAPERAAALDADRLSACGFYSFEFHSMPALLSRLSPAAGRSAAFPPARVLAFVRKPITQVLSLFRHIRKYLKYAKCRSPADIVSGRCRAFDFRNMQVTRLGDGSLEAAKRSIDRMFFLGIFEYYETSICLLSYQLGQLDLKLCSCASRPTGQLVPTSMSTNRSRADLVSVQDITELEELLLLDNELYEYSLHAFLRRVMYVEAVTNATLLCHPQRTVDDMAQLRLTHSAF